MNRFAKIVATLGPSCQTKEQIQNLISAGVDVARLNFSHGTHQEHAERIAILRQLSEEMKRPIAILQDLQGPKIRVGEISQGKIKLAAGQYLILSTQTHDSTVGDNNHPTIIPMEFPQLSESVRPGNHILLDDGQLELEVIQVETGLVKTRILLGGDLSSHKGVNLPGAVLNIPSFTEKDRVDLEFGLANGVDMVAISFVRTANDVTVVREAMQQIKPSQFTTPIIAKLERPEALDNLEAILDCADGVMVARGDLGVEMSPASVPIAQKQIITGANKKNKYVITATQMLDSMIHNPRPTRAETSDVANAIFDGTDAAMLSGETASGKYPVESVRMMANIICQAESSYGIWGKHDDHGLIVESEDDAIAMTRAAREVAHDRNVAAIAVFTLTGKTALLMSKMRPRVPILGLTPEFSVYQCMQSYWGVKPILVPFATTMEEMIQKVEDGLLRYNEVEPGQQVVVLSGFPIGAWRAPNLALLHTIGEKFS